MNHSGMKCAMVAALLTPLVGCGTLAKQAYYEARGAQGELFFVRAIGTHELARFQSVSFEPLESTLGPELCPADLRAAYDQNAQDFDAQLKQWYPGGEPALNVESEALYFQKKGLLSGAQFLTRVRMKENEQVVADMVVKVESRAFRKGDEKALAKASVQELARFLTEQKKTEDEKE